MEAPKPQAGRKRPRGGPFRIRVGSVVALRQNRSSGGLWTPPDHTTDTGVLLIGKWIRCYLPDKQQVEGQVLKMPMSDAKETFQVDLLVQEALLKNLPDLSTVPDPPSSKNQQLEDQIRGPGRVVRLTLATPWYLSSRNTKRHRWAVLRSSTGGKYRGDGRDDETRQLINGRWVAARQDVQQQYKVTHMETQTTGSSSLATVGLQQVFLRGHQVRVGTEEKEVPIEQVILIARRIGETSEMGEDGIVNHLQLIEGPEETKFTSERVGPFENHEAFRQFAQARREFDFSSSFDGSASKKLLTKTPKLPTPKIEKKRKASATNGSAKKVKVKSEKNGVKRKTEKNGVHEKTPTANGEKRKIGRPKSPKRSTSPKPSGKRSTSPKPTKRNDIKNGVKSKPLPEDTIFQNTCARFVDYDKLRQWHYQRGNSLQVPPEKMRNLRDLPLYNPMPEADREEVPSGRAARASQRRMMKDVVSMGPMLSIDTLANRESQLRFDRSSIHAWGVFADKDIAAGEMVVEYRGELIGNSIAERREAEYEKAKIGSDYMFRMDGMQVCDATKQGNVARFINASCGPNCYTKIITLDGNKRIVIYAKRDIRAGEELCYDYKFPLEYDESKRIPCHCGTKECRGYMNWVRSVVSMVKGVILTLAYDRIRSTSLCLRGRRLLQRAMPSPRRPNWKRKGKEASNSIIINVNVACDIGCCCALSS